MDTIRFLDSGGLYDGVHIIINNRDLLEIVREVELPFATREQSPRLAGSYGGLPAEAIFLPSRHMLGEPEPYYSFGDGRTYLYACQGCGEPGCWGLATRIEVNADTVVWQDFITEHRGPGSRAGEWCYDAMPVFRFERKAYELALQAPAAGA